MSINRAWVRRPLLSPPHYGRSAPPVWLESVVTFARIATAPDEVGGFSSSTAPVAFLTTAAHCEFQQGHTRLTRSESVEDVILQRILRIIMPFPEFQADMPRRDDQITWTQDTGETLVTHVRSVESPLNMGDHLEIESEVFI